MVVFNAGQNRIYTLYMIVYMVNFLPKILYTHRIYMVLANPSYFSWSCQFMLSLTLWELAEQPTFLYSLIVHEVNILLLAAPSPNTKCKNACHAVLLRGNEGLPVLNECATFHRIRDPTFLQKVSCIYIILAKPYCS
jgi:hypothetical protein